MVKSTILLNCDKELKGSGVGQALRFQWRQCLQVGIEGTGKREREEMCGTREPLVIGIVLVRV